MINEETESPLFGNAGRTGSVVRRLFDGKMAQRESIDVINWEEYSYKPIVAFDIARSKVNLYIRYFVKGNSLKALYETDGSPVYQDSCVEFFMKRVNDPNYYNFEFNCIGTCDASYRESRDSKKSLTPEEYASIRRFSSLPHVAFTEKLGVYSWELVVAIPFRLMGLDPDNLPEKIMATSINVRTIRNFRIS